MLLRKIYLGGSAEPPFLIYVVKIDQLRLVGALSRLLELGIPVRVPARAD